MDLLAEQLLNADAKIQEAAAVAWEAARISEDAEVRAAFDAGRDHALNKLIVIVASDQPQKAWVATDALARLRVPERHVFDAFFSVLSHADANIRFASLSGLDGLRGLISKEWFRGRIPSLVARLDDADPRVRALALGIMANACEAEGWPNAKAVESACAQIFAAAKDKSADVRASAARTLGRVPWQNPERPIGPLKKVLEDEDAKVREEAALALRVLHRNAKGALSTLRKHFGDPDFGVRCAAASATWEISHDSKGIVPIVDEALKRLDGPELSGPARMACEIGPRAEAAVPGLISALGRIPPIRHWTNGDEELTALYSIGPAAGIALPLLEKILENKESEARWSAAKAVAAVNADPEKLTDVLERYHKDEKIQGAVYDALGKIGAATDDKVAFRIASLLAEGLAAKDGWARLTAAKGLAGLGAHASPALDAVLKALDNHPSGQKEWYVTQMRKALCETVGNIGNENASRGIQARLEQQPDLIVLLGACGSAAKDAVPALLGWLDRHPGAVARALIGIQPDDKTEALKALQAQLSKTEGVDRMDVAEAVLRFGDNSSPALDVLIAGLADRDPDAKISMAAVNSLRRLGSLAIAAAPALERLMNDEKAGDANFVAATALYQIKGNAKRILPALLEGVRYHIPSNIHAVEGLGVVGAEAAETVPDLMKAAEYWRGQFYKDDALLCRAAIKALGCIGKKAKAALPLLNELQRNVLFRRAAKEALRQIEGSDHP